MSPGIEILGYRRWSQGTAGQGADSGIAFASKFLSRAFFLEMLEPKRFCG
jgi:hypothetical protein